MKELTYLATPFSHPERRIRVSRYMRACDASARLIKRGFKIICPVVHGYGIATIGGLKGDWKQWREMDIAILTCCKDMIVLKIDGWETSEGIKAEMEFAMANGIPVKFCDEWGNIT